MLNKIAIHGRLCRDPEFTTTQSGVPKCALCVAVDRSFAKQGEEKQTDFFDVVTWRGLAETVSKYFSKGMEIVIYGSMQSQKWTDKDGKNRVSWSIVADSIDFCGSRSNGSSGSHGHENSNTEPPNNIPSEDFTPILDDDIPF